MNGGQRIDVKAVPGAVMLEVVVGPVAFSVVIKPLQADQLAGAMQRAAIEANAPRLVVPPPVANQ